MAQGLNHVYRRNENFVFRRIDDETLLVPIRAGVGDLDCLYSLNPVGAWIWENMDGRRDLAALRDRLTAEYKIAGNAAEADLLDFVHEMAAIEALIPAARDNENTPKKKYEKPRLARIRLDAQTAVLGFCKGAAGGGPVSGSCDDALGDNCLSQGS